MRNTFCITGILAELRDDVIKKFESKGLKYTNSVTKNTEFLIVGDMPGKSKFDKAKQLGTKIIEEADRDNILTQIKIEMIESL